MMDEWQMMDDGWWMMEDGWWMMEDGWWMMDDGWWITVTAVPAKDPKTEREGGGTRCSTTDDDFACQLD